MQFHFDYFYTTVGIIGASRTGKSYITAQLLKLAGKRSSVLVHSPLTKEQYKAYSDDVKVSGETGINAQIVDNFIEIRKNKKVWLLVFDDLDLFVHNAKESKMLENLPVLSKGYWQHGNIWQSRRMVNLPYPLFQNSDYLIFSYGVDTHDYDDLEKYTGLDLQLYKTLPAPVRSKSDPRKLEKAWYLLLNTETKEQEIIDGFS